MVCSGPLAQFSGKVFHNLQYTAEKGYFHLRLGSSFKKLWLFQVKTHSSLNSLAGMSGNLVAAAEDKETKWKSFESLLLDHNLPS